MSSSISSSDALLGRTYLKKVLWLFLASCGVFAGINLAVDPAHLYGDYEYEHEVALALLQGKMLANLRNYDERLVQRYYVKGLEAAPEVVVLGSSRAMTLRSSDLGSPRAFNHSVSGASLPDLLAIWQLYRARGWRPQRLVMVVDPWIFNRHNKQVRWRSLGAELAAISRQLGLDPSLQGKASGEERLGTLFSLPYLADSLRDLLLGAESAATKSFVTDDSEHPDGVKFSDGATISPAKRRGLSVAAVAADAAGFTKRGAYSLEGFDRVDSSLRDTFDRFLDFLHDEGVEVVIVLAPYHPLTYRALLTDGYGVVAMVERYLRDDGARRGIAVRGSYSPTVAGCNETHFTDGMHPTRECLALILSTRQ